MESGVPNHPGVCSRNGKYRTFRKHPTSSVSGSFLLARLAGNFEQQVLSFRPCVTWAAGNQSDPPLSCRTVVLPQTAETPFSIGQVSYATAVLRISDTGPMASIWIYGILNTFIM
jgi:hypothetical protein